MPVRLISLFLLSLWLVWATPGFAGGRVALLIANGRYEAVSSLANPRNDVALVAASLRSVGFTSVVVENDLDKAGMDAALLKFGQLADGAEMAVIYYAGHGIEIGGRNFLIPTNARLARDRDADFEAVVLESVLRVIETAAFKLVILDACRNNPFAAQMAINGQGRSVGRGLAEVRPEGETLVVYATRAGAYALDGDGSNSPFAMSLAQRLIEPGVEIRLMVGRVRDDVMAATQRQQEPFTYGSLSGTERYLAGRAQSGGTVSAVAVDPLQIEALVWQGALAANSRQSYEDYLARYGRGVFAGQATANLEKFKPLPAVATGLVMPVPARDAPAGSLSLAAIRKEPIARLYANSIGPQCRNNFANRYPFYGASQDDVTLTALNDVFGSGGSLRLLLRERLMPLLDTTGPVWRWRNSPARDPAIPDELEKSTRIQKLVEEGLRFTVTLSAKSDTIDAVEFSNGGVTSRFERAGGDPTPIIWALQGAPTASVVLFSKGQVVQRYDEVGQWALFRLMDRATKENSGPTAFIAEFGGKENRARLKFNLPSEYNPFSRGGMWSFRCPTAI